MAKEKQPYSNGWIENKKLVLHRLEDIEHEVRRTRKRVEELEKQMAVYKAQSRMYAGLVGAIAGLIPTVVAIMLNRL